jgi:4-amino-4-deoxy-L-arabinose transferase-like glycosyltransferase
MPFQSERGPHPWARPSLLLGLATLGIHLLVNGGYGYSRDELYFIVCGERLAWGYVDQPPLVPLVAALSYRLLGNSLVAFRLAPALAMSATVALTAEFARLLSKYLIAFYLLALGAGLLATPLRRSLRGP